MPRAGSTKAGIIVEFAEFVQVQNGVSGRSRGDTVIKAIGH